MELFGNYQKQDTRGSRVSVVSLHAFLSRDRLEYLQQSCHISNIDLIECRSGKNYKAYKAECRQENLAL